MTVTTSTLATAIETELERLDWLATAENPCAFVVDAREDLPVGWVRLSDDYAGFVGPAADILEALKDLSEDDEYGSGLNGFDERMSSQNWPAELMSIEQLEEGTPNDNPNTLFTLQTNAGVRYAAGPHGVSYCVIRDWHDDKFAVTREEAIEIGCEFSE